MQPQTQINVRQFKRVLILYNRYSGKQLFASMMSRINEVYKLLKQELAAEINLVDVKLFEQMPEIAKEAAEKHKHYHKEGYENSSKLIDSLFERPKKYIKNNK